MECGFGRSRRTERFRGLASVLSLGSLVRVGRVQAGKSAGQGERPESRDGLRVWVMDFGLGRRRGQGQGKHPERFCGLAVTNPRF